MLHENSWSRSKKGIVDCNNKINLLSKTGPQGLRRMNQHSERAKVSEKVGKWLQIWMTGRQSLLLRVMPHENLKKRWQLPSRKNLNDRRRKKRCTLFRHSCYRRRLTRWYRVCKTVTATIIKFYLLMHPKTAKRLLLRKRQVEAMALEVRFPRLLNPSTPDRLLS